jgi:hypothetical protein
MGRLTPCPRCGDEEFEVLEDEVDIGVGTISRVYGGICKSCGELAYCENCGGWDGQHRRFCYDISKGLTGNS